MKIKHVAFFALCTQDMKRSIAFYEGLLGLKRLDTQFGDDWVEYDIGGATLAIIGRHFPQTQMGQFASGITFEVDDVDAWFEKFKAAGVPVLMPPTDMPSCYSAILSDPDNNIISFHQLHA